MNHQKLSHFKNILHQELNIDVPFALVAHVYQNADVICEQANEKGWDHPDVRASVLALGANSLVGHPLSKNDDQETQDQFRATLIEHIKAWKLQDANDNEAVV